MNSGREKEAVVGKDKLLSWQRGTRERLTDAGGAGGRWV